jgi:hypothetical protein
MCRQSTAPLVPLRVGGSPPVQVTDPAWSRSQSVRRTSARSVISASFLVRSRSTGVALAVELSAGATPDAAGQL